MIICIYIFLCFHSVFFFFLFISLFLPYTHSESAVSNVQRNLKRVIKKGEKQLPFFFFSLLQGYKGSGSCLVACLVVLQNERLGETRVCISLAALRSFLGLRTAALIQLLRFLPAFQNSACWAPLQRA